jgi:hypothetical protein
MKDAPINVVADMVIAAIFDGIHASQIPWGIRQVLWTAGYDVTPRWQPLDTAPIPPPEGLPSYWEFRCLIQSESGVVCEGYASYVGNYRKQKGNDKPPILRWYRSRNGRVERNAKYWMPLPAPLTDGLKGGD